MDDMTMHSPFDRYLEPREGSSSESGRSPYTEYEDSVRASLLGIDNNTFSNQLQFQIPHYLLPPNLAPGGGAEAIPAGMFGSPGSVNSSWFAQNGFTPRFSDEAYISSSKQALLDQDAELEPSQAQISSEFGIQSPTDSRVSHRPLFTPPDLNALITGPEPFLPSAPRAVLSAQQLLAFYGDKLNAPSPHGLPVYSASGFDLLSILGRVATRPNPTIVLGPVDMTCSFVVVDVRRYDCPIVYCSPSFTKLTGYDEHEVLGRNCRFLQAPDGNVQKGEPRRFTSPEAVAHLKKSLTADKECQMSIINYRKGGTAFINMVTVIPISGGVLNTPEEADQVAYHVGFQVDLTEQPNAILQKLKDGSYIVNYANNGLPTANLGGFARDRKSHGFFPKISKDLQAMLSDSLFMQSLPLTTSTNMPTTGSSSEKAEAHDANQPLNLLLLESSPDFILVVSLKGSFLYAAPSVRRVLGYEPEELVGKSISDYCHPADVVPLMRELKESSATPGAHHEGVATQIIQPPLSSTPKSVDLLFRAQSKTQGYVWVECQGRLHVEPGKGRKAIILSGRAKAMPKLDWSYISSCGGLALPMPSQTKLGADASQDATQTTMSEFWGWLSHTGTIIVVGDSSQDVLGWQPVDLVGKPMSTLLADDDDVRRKLEEILMGSSAEPRRMSCDMRRSDGTSTRVDIVIHNPENTPLEHSTSGPSPPQLIYQIKLTEPSSRPTSLAHSLSANVFDEMETSRGSSWQYELQQLKFANARLVEEIEAIEGTSQSSKISTVSAAKSALPQETSTSSNDEWPSATQPEWCASPTLKRSWDASTV